MGAKASTEAIDKAEPGTGIHTADGTHFFTINLDSNNDGSSVHPSSLLFIIGLTVFSFILLCRFMRCLRKKHADWSDKYHFARRPDQNEIEMGPVNPAPAAAPGGGEPGRPAPAPPRRGE